jgi:hypothetical protein
MVPARVRRTPAGGWPTGRMLYSDPRNHATRRDLSIRHSGVSPRALESVSQRDIAFAVAGCCNSFGGWLVVMLCLGLVLVAGASITGAALHCGNLVEEESGSIPEWWLFLSWWLSFPPPRAISLFLL